jgi:hypothetical protein
MAPNTIILDTYSHMSELRALANDYREIPELADDLAQDLIERIQSRKNAVFNVNNLVLDIRMHHFEYMDDEPLDEVFAKPVQQLGMCLIEQLDRIGAYDINGVLHYHLHLPPNSNPNDIMITQTCAIAYFKGDTPR